MKMVVAIKLISEAVTGVLCEKNVLKIFANLTGKHLC